MTDKELQFHYFKLHDFDNNNLLDGLEIVKAIKHSHDEHGNTNATVTTIIIWIQSSFAFPFHWKPKEFHVVPP